MKHYYAHAYLALLLAWISQADVRLPAVPVVPSPMPDPAAPTLLTEELIFVVDSDTEAVVLCSPAGRLKITADKGPMTLRGKLVGGTGGVEKREF